MAQMNVKLFFVFCLAGIGKRFTDEGINCPKYLLSFNSKITILEKAIKNFRFKDNVKIVFCCNEIHLDYKKDIQKIIIKNNLNADIIFTESTNGQAHTAFISSKYIKSSYQDYYHNKPIAFFNGDTILKNRSMDNLLLDMGNYSGLIDCFLSNDPKFSFIKKDKKNFVLDIEEKVCISENATSGLYFFSSPLTYIKEFVEEGYIDSEEETYISYIYNIY